MTRVLEETSLAGRTESSVSYPSREVAKVELLPDAGSSMRLEDTLTVQDNIMRSQQLDDGEEALGTVKECTAKRDDLAVRLNGYNVCKANLESILEKQVDIMNALKCNMKQLEKRVRYLEVYRKLLDNTVEELMRNCSGGKSVLRKTVGEW